MKTQRENSVKRILLIFVDGLGVGKRDSQINPMAKVLGPYLSVFEGEDGYDSGVSKPLDALLDVEGIPQSATGQTALLTGINASKVLGYHLFGFPNPKLQEIIKSHSIIKKVRDAGLKPAFINAFRPRFFEMGDSVWEKGRLSVTTWVNHAADLSFFSLEDVKLEKCIYQDFTNGELIEQGFDLPLFSPEKAGEILAKEHLNYDFTLFEYFRTDAAGHSKNMDRATEEIRRLEAFLGEMLKNTNLEETLVILSSDHGNIEDLSVRGHTKNKAMTLLFGVGADRAAQGMESILDMTATVTTLLSQ